MSENLTIKERMEACEKLQSEEGIRHNLRCRELFEMSQQIQKDCTHLEIQNIQCSPEAIDVCKDCGKMIL